MDLSRLENLRIKIATVKDLAEAFEYFFDQFGEIPEFFEVGAPAEDDLLMTLLSHVGGTMFKTKRVSLRNMRLI